MGDIVKNFSYSEFKPKGSNALWKPSFALQDTMIKTLAQNLQIVRDEWNKPLSINSGVREASDIARLISEGYHTSPISDHFAGNVVPIEIMNPRFKIFGSYYCFSVGAADIHSENAGDLFKLSLSLNRAGKTKFGQIIWEKDPDKKTEWVHFGNNRKDFYSQIICDLIAKGQYLFTIDGGKTYQNYTL